jgi:hypothetical protein
MSRGQFPIRQTDALVSAGLLALIPSESFEIRPLEFVRFAQLNATKLCGRRKDARSSMAEPGSIVIADNTKNFIGDLFECRDLGNVIVKGYEEPIGWVDRSPNATRRGRSGKSGSASPLAYSSPLLMVCRH